MSPKRQRRFVIVGERKDVCREVVVASSRELQGDGYHILGRSTLTHPSPGFGAEPPLRGSSTQQSNSHLLTATGYRSANRARLSRGRCSSRGCLAARSPAGLSSGSFRRGQRRVRSLRGRVCGFEGPCRLQKHPTRSPFPILRPMPGPSWLGIGAQRSGTGWVSRLLIQHPRVGFATNGKKEQAYLHLIPDGELTEAAYLALFPDDGLLRGEWSPHYLPSMIVPHLAARLTLPTAPVFVLLRDPVERFLSGMRLAKKTKRIPTDFHEPWVVRAHQYGHYASSLEGWSTAFERSRFVILTYEEALADVDRACATFWAALGLDPHPLTDRHRQVKPSTEGSINWDWPAGTREALVAHYLPDVRRLRDDWGVDVSRWANFRRALS